MTQCVCCSKEVQLKPSYEVLRDDSGNVVYEEKSTYFYELDDYVQLSTPVFVYSEPLCKSVAVTLDNATYVQKYFCEECYGYFVQEHVDKLISVLSTFKTQKGN